MTRIRVIFKKLLYLITNRFTKAQRHVLMNGKTVVFGGKTKPFQTSGATGNAHPVKGKKLRPHGKIRKLRRRLGIDPGKAKHPLHHAHFGTFSPIKPIRARGPR